VGNVSRHDQLPGRNIGRQVQISVAEMSLLAFLVYSTRMLDCGSCQAHLITPTEGNGVTPPINLETILLLDPRFQGRIIVLLVVKLDAAQHFQGVYIARNHFTVLPLPSSL
jgi:hypothetical protein